MKLIINGKEAEIKFTIGAWKKLKQEGVTPINIEEKVKEDVGDTLFKLIKCSLTKEYKETIQDEDIEELDINIINTLIKEMTEQTPSIETDDGKKN